MIANTEAQGSLHPGLIGPDAANLIDLARSHRAIGWKANGAGGGGGSVTLLSTDPEGKEALERGIVRFATACRLLPIELSPDGLRVEGRIRASSSGRPF